MTIWLRQSTAADVVIGAAIDDTDGKTPETALTLSQADCQLSKNGGAVAQKNDASSASHLGGGHYKVPLNTTDTNTLGRLRLYINETGALPMWMDFMVVPANVWDSFFGADALQVHAVEIANDLITAAAIATNAIDDDAIATGAIASTAFAAGAITAAAIATDAIDNDALSADAVTAIQSGLSTVTTAQVNAEVVDALSVDTYAEPGSVPAATASIVAKLSWLYTLARNKRTTTATADVIRNDADSGTIGTSTLADNGTTFTRGEYS